MQGSAKATVYISSTYEDLKQYRHEVTGALRKINVDVIGMEDYGAESRRPLQRCLEDVRRADVYLGFLAWRYGFVPREDNPAGQSITELEYRQALASGKPCLIFLLDEKHPWPLSFIDKDPHWKRIEALRAEVTDRHLVGFFREPGDLASLVLASVRDQLSVRPPLSSAAASAPVAAPPPPIPSGLRRALRGHADAVRCVAMTGDGRRAASGGWDKTVRVWDLETGRQLHVLTGHAGSIEHPGTVYGVALDPVQQRVLSCGYDGTIRAWDLEAGRQIRQLQGHRGPVRAMDLAADGIRLATAGADRTVRLWNVDEYRPMTQVEIPTGQPTSLAMSRDGAVIGVGTTQGLWIWEPDTGRQPRRVPKSVYAIQSVALAPDGSLVLTGDIDGTMILWDAHLDVEIRRFPGHSRAVRAAVMSGDLRRVVSGGDDTTMRVWDLSTGYEVGIFDDHHVTVLSLALSGDGRRAASGASDGIVRVWDLP